MRRASPCGGGSMIVLDEVHISERKKESLNQKDEVRIRFMSIFFFTTEIFCPVAETRTENQNETRNVYIFPIENTTF